VKVLARAPGRVNLIGDHTDYTGGLVLPMAIDRETVVELERGGPWVELVSATEDEAAFVHFDDPVEPASRRPQWARYVAGVVAVLQPEEGGIGFVRTTLPIGAGLSSSAALEVAVALALGFEGSPLDLALACQQAEQVASGVPCGIMDQLASAAGIVGHALLMDFTTLAVEPVPVPPDATIVVVHSGQERTLAGSAYGERRAACERAAGNIGPLLDADLATVERLADPTVRARARHVVTENQRVRDFAAAFRAGDLVDAGRLMGASHRSLRDDFEVSTPVLDALVTRLTATRGVFGARLTGAGFGGCVVALTEPGVLDEGWTVHASAGAAVVTSDR
jgi:galactokinase